MSSVLFVCLSLAIASSNPAAVNAHKEGMRLAKNNAVPEAIEKLEQAVKIDPEFSEAWADLGNTHLSAGAMDEAIRAFAQAVRIRGDFQIARYNLAYALRKTGSHAKAAEQYRIYLQRDPDDADAWYGLAESLRQSGEAAAAADAYDQYAKVEKRPAQSKWVKKAAEQSRELRKTAAGQPPKTPVQEPPAKKKEPIAAAPVTASKHVSFSAKAKKEEAPAPVAQKEAPVVEQTGVVEKKTAKPAQPVKRSESFDSGLQALKAGDYETALLNLDAAAKVAPEDAIVLAALGSAHLGLRNGKEAELAYRRALATAKPEAVPGIWLGIGEAMRVLGDSKQALEAFDHVAKDEGASASLKQMASERAAALQSIN